MKIPLQKSFRLLKFLNRNHPSPIRLPVAVFAYLAAFLATFRHALSAEVFDQCWSENDFKLAARRGAWYFRRGWLNLDVSQDDFFDFTEGFSDTQLDNVEEFIEGRKSKLPALTYTADKAYITARRLDNNTKPEAREATVRELSLWCNSLLACDPDTPTSNKVSKKKRKGDFPIENAKQTLADFINLFPTNEVPWFLVSGTFLGLIRNKGFLPHDYDIDLGLFEEEADIPSIRQKILDSDRFVLKKYDHHRSSFLAPPSHSKDKDVPYILKIIHVSGVHIDLFIHYKDDDKSGSVVWHGSSLHRWENSSFELVEYDFYDWRVLGPANPDRYLSENYGDWKTPVTDFNCTTDTPNLALVPHPIAVVTFLKRYVLSKTTNPADAAKLKHSLLANGFLRQLENDQTQFSSDLYGATS